MKTQNMVGLLVLVLTSLVNIVRAEESAFNSMDGKIPPFDYGRCCHYPHATNDVGDKIFRDSDLVVTISERSPSEVLSIPEEIYERLSFVFKRLYHSTFTTWDIPDGGNSIHGLDWFSFFFKMNESGSVVLSWDFWSYYPNKRGMYGPVTDDGTAFMVGFRF